MQLERTVMISVWAVLLVCSSTKPFNCHSLKSQGEIKAKPLEGIRTVTGAFLDVPNRLEKSRTVKWATNQPTTILSASFGSEAVLRPEALQSIKRCSRMAALSALVDLVTLRGATSAAAVRSIEYQNFILSGDYDLPEWVSGVFAPLVEHNYQHKSGLIVAAILWKVGFSVGLNRNIKLQENLSPTENLLLPIKRLFRIMGRLWRQATILLSAQCLLNLLEILLLDEQALIHRKATGNLSSLHQRLLGAGHLICSASLVLVATSTVLNRIHNRQTEAIRKRTSQDLSEAGIQAKDAGLLSLHYIVICTTVLFLDSYIKAIVGILQTSAWLSRGLQFSGVATSFGLARLLWRLRRSLTSALDACLKAPTIECIASETKLELYERQKDFYGEVRDTFATDAIIKVGLGAFALVRSSLRPAPGL